MSPIHRTTARVLPVSPDGAVLRLSREVKISFANRVPDEIGHVFAARWWLPEDLETEPFADPGLPGIMRTAAAAVRGES